jgi:trk system potassium uptake protein TrkA
MYIIIAGAGKVGWNLARELMAADHEVTVVESNRERYMTVEEELEHNVHYGDASELWVLERAGIVRADMVIAVTGDDEDNILISQVAKEKYLVEHTIARVNNPRNVEHFDLLNIRPVVSATDLILRLIEHEVPHHGLVHLLDLKQEQLEIIEIEVSPSAPAAGRPIGELDLPEGCLVVSVLRDGTGFVPNAETVIHDGDEVLAVLSHGQEAEVLELFAPRRGAEDGKAARRVD